MGLLVLRLAILLLFAAVFIGAVFTHVWTERPRRVAVMLDVSESMIAVGAESAAAAVAEAFPLPEGATGQEWMFGDTAKTIADFRLPIADSATTRRTRVGAALKAVGKTRPGAVVVLSDGQDNGEIDAVAAARGIGVPVHTVGFGGLAKRNASVRQVVLPAVVYSGDTVDVQVRVMTIGFESGDEPSGEPGERGRGVVRVKLRGKERDVPVGPGTSEQDVPFRVVFARPGRQVIEARVDSLVGEGNYADNTRSVTVDVKPGRLRVAYVTNRPGPQTRMMLRALEGDERIQVDTVVSVTGGISEVPAADVFVLDNVVESGSPVVWQSIADRVQAGTGALMLAGPDFQPGQKIGEVLGGIVGRMQLGTFTPELTAEGAILPWWGELRSEGQIGRDGFDLASVPPFTGLRSLNSGSSSPAANRQSPVVNGMAVWLAAQENRAPLVVAGKEGKGRVVYVAAYPLWRWGFEPEERPEQGTPLSAFVAGVVRYLAERDTNPFWLEVDRPDLYQGQPVRFTMRAVAADGRPWSGLSVMVEVVAASVDSARQTNPESRNQNSESRSRAQKPEGISVPMTEAGAGVYEATIEALGPGRYRAIATAEQARSQGIEGSRDQVGRATTEFSVAEQALELANTGMNEGLLRAISEASGGRFFVSDSLPREGAEIALGSYQRRFTFDPRRAVWAYVLIALLAGGEWLLRRRRGML